MMTLVRVVGLTLIIWILFITPVLQAQGIADSAWVTRDIVPHLDWSCGSVVLGNGIVMTARHCTQDGISSYTLITSKNLWQADLLCRSSLETDVATLRADIMGSVMTLRYPSNLVGEDVIVAGYPSGQFVVMVGRVLWIARNATPFLPTKTIVPLIYVISNPSGKGPVGFSGGPVFDTHRRLVGIICCGNPVLGIMAMIPLERQVAECPL